MTLEFTHYWICSSCAQERGGIWPEGHVATFSKMPCKYCNGQNQNRGEHFISPWVDYDWPNKETTKIAKFSRD